MEITNERCKVKGVMRRFHDAQKKENVLFMLHSLIIYDNKS